jgi:hypothetical protein
MPAKHEEQTKSTFTAPTSHPENAKTSSKPCIKMRHEHSSAMNHTIAAQQGQEDAKANRKGPTASAQCGGRSTTGLFNNRYL